MNKRKLKLAALILIFALAVMKRQRAKQLWDDFRYGKEEVKADSAKNTAILNQIPVDQRDEVIELINPLMSQASSYLSAQEENQVSDIVKCNSGLKMYLMTFLIILLQETEKLTDKTSFIKYTFPQNQNLFFKVTPQSIEQKYMNKKSKIYNHENPESRVYFIHEAVVTKMSQFENVEYELQISMNFHGRNDLMADFFMKDYRMQTQYDTTTNKSHYILTVQIPRCSA